MSITPKLIEHSVMSSSDEIRLYGVLHNSIDLVWNEIEPYLNDALSYGQGEHTKQEIYNALCGRDMQLWVAYNDSGCLAMCITQIHYFPRCKRLSLLYAGGEEMETWVHHWHTIKEWAKEQGCTKCRFYGRDGWQKKFKCFGFKKIYTVLEADL